MNHFSRMIKQFLRILARLCPAILLVSSIQPLRGQNLSVDISHDVTAHLEYLGNPFAAKFPDGEMVYARNVWDMELFQGRLYMGHGNSNNGGPAPNAGPIDIWSFDLETGVFSAEYLVAEEQIDRFSVVEGHLFVPGNDPITGGTENIYRLAEGGWEIFGSIRNTAHIYGFSKIGDHWLAAIMSGSQNALAVSEDGVNWNKVNLPSYVTEDQTLYSPVAWEVANVNGLALISAQSPVIVVDHNDGATELKAVGSSAFLVDHEDVVALEVNLFPGREWNPLETGPFRMARSTLFSEQIIYIGANVWGHHWLPFMLGVVDRIDSDLRVTELRLPIGLLPWDIGSKDDQLYVLVSSCPSFPASDACINSVYVTCDLLGWKNVLSFQAITFARSFAYDGDAFYFGLGTLTEPLSPASGDILRVSSDVFDIACD